MDAQTDFPSGYESLLREWDEIDVVIEHSEKLLERLRLRMSELEDSLDKITRPPEVLTHERREEDGPMSGADDEQPRSAPPRLVYIPCGFTYRNLECTAIEKIDIHKALMRHLIEDFPDRLDDLLRTLHSIGRSRKYLTRDRSDLFAAKAPEWVLRHSTELLEGWYVDTNLCESMMDRILREAVRSVGLKWGEDVIIRWRSRCTNP